MAIEKLTGFAGGIGTGALKGVTEPAAAGFEDTLSRMVQAVESTEAGANTAVTNMVQGTGDVHDAMISLQQADLTFQLSMQIRNKLVQAYQEVMRMTV